MKTILYVFIIFLIFLSGGCKKEQTAVRTDSGNGTAGPDNRTEAGCSGDAVETETYQYDAKGERSFLSLVEKAKPEAGEEEGASPFESHEIEEMQVLAMREQRQTLCPYYVAG